MPFGTHISAEGVHFRLWAPAAQQVELWILKDDEEHKLPMHSLNDGWFGLVTQADVGTRYSYRINDQINVPDPASRYNPDDVHSPSEIVNPSNYQWNDSEWQGRPWEEAVIYEIHIGTFTLQGTFLAAIERLDYLVDLGITAIELMPIADFPGKRNWGYDGALLFAPDSAYGRPEELKQLIDAAHNKGLMVLLDVVYNHFGPEGNYLHIYAPQFFTKRHQTPWGAAINFDSDGSHTVRDFFIHNALYWLEEYHFDGLRFDAVHAIIDDSNPHILAEIAETIWSGPGKERHIHLVLENDHNAARYLSRDEAGKPRYYTAQWNDDIHHAFHVVATGESDGYYSDYIDKPVARLARCLTEGFAYQGGVSKFRQGEMRGEPSRHLPPGAFVGFMQNHDQIGNRAFGERLSLLAPVERLRALTAIMLLAPFPPLLFMGEEFGASTPFLFFCNFDPNMSKAVRDGRRKEFAKFARFSEPSARKLIPDPNDVTTFEKSILDWDCLDASPHDAWLDIYRTLLTIRRDVIVPRLSGIQGGHAGSVIGMRGLRVHWLLNDGSMLSLIANLDDYPLIGVEHPAGELICATHDLNASDLSEQGLPPWYVAWFIDVKNSNDTV